jgi:hypothetical protein
MNRLGRGRGEDGLGPRARPPGSVFSTSSRTLFPILLVLCYLSHLQCCHVSKRYLPFHGPAPPCCSCPHALMPSCTLMTHPYSEKGQLSPLSWCVKGMLCPPRPVLGRLALVPLASSSLDTVLQRLELHAVHWRLPTSPPQYCILST